MSAATPYDRSSTKVDRNVALSMPPISRNASTSTCASPSKILPIRSLSSNVQQRPSTTHTAVLKSSPYLTYKSNKNLSIKPSTPLSRRRPPTTLSQPIITVTSAMMARRQKGPRPRWCSTNARPSTTDTDHRLDFRYQEGHDIGWKVKDISKKAQLTKQKMEDEARLAVQHSKNLRKSLVTTQHREASWDISSELLGAESATPLETKRKKEEVRKILPPLPLSKCFVEEDEVDDDDESYEEDSDCSNTDYNFDDYDKYDDSEYVTEQSQISQDPRDSIHSYRSTNYLTSNDVSSISSNSSRSDWEESNYDRTAPTNQFMQSISERQAVLDFSKNSNEIANIRPGTPLHGKRATFQKPDPLPSIIGSPINESEPDANEPQIETHCIEQANGPLTMPSAGGEKSEEKSRKTEVLNDGEMVNNTPANCNKKPCEISENEYTEEVVHNQESTRHKTELFQEPTAVNSDPANEINSPSELNDQALASVNPEDFASLLGLKGRSQTPEFSVMSTKDVDDDYAITSKVNFDENNVKSSQGYTPASEETLSELRMENESDYNLNDDFEPSENDQINDTEAQSSEIAASSQIHSAEETGTTLPIPGSEDNSTRDLEGAPAAKLLNTNSTIYSEGNESHLNDENYRISDQHATTNPDTLDSEPLDEALDDVEANQASEVAASANLPESSELQPTPSEEARDGTLVQADGPECRQADQKSSEPSEGNQTAEVEKLPIILELSEVIPSSLEESMDVPQHDAPIENEETSRQEEIPPLGDLSDLQTDDTSSEDIDSSHIQEAGEDPTLPSNPDDAQQPETAEDNSVPHVPINTNVDVNAIFESEDPLNETSGNIGSGFHHRNYTGSGQITTIRRRSSNDSIDINEHQEFVTVVRKANQSIDSTMNNLRIEEDETNERLSKAEEEEKVQEQGELNEPMFINVS